MRTYPTDSPQSAARIVALALIADGHVSPEELDSLDRADAYERIGITPGGMQLVLQDLCEDMLQTHRTTWTGACRLEPRTIDMLLSEVEAPGLRSAVMNTCMRVASADGDLAEGESILLATALASWATKPMDLRSPPSGRTSKPSAARRVATIACEPGC
jgi:hypothetical protein